MNFNGLETFLIGMVAATLILGLFIYLGNRVLNFLKIPDPAKLKPKFRHSAPNFDGKASERENPGGKIAPKPDIIYPLAD